MTQEQTSPSPQWSRMQKGFLLSSVYVALVLPAYGQNVDIHETSVSSTARGATATFSLTNRANKSIAAYILRAELYDDSGKLALIRGQSAILGFAGSAARAPIRPGETWTDQVDIPVDQNKKPVQHHISVDFVLFTDNSTSGPDATKTAARLLGLMQGIKAERARLRALLKRGGSQAITEDLARQ